VDLLAGLYSVQQLPGLKFALKVDENIQKLESELAPLNKLMEPTPEFEAFAEKVRDEAGNDPEKRKKLEEENKELVDHRVNQIETAREMLSEPKEIKLRKIYVSELPKEINAAQIKALKPILLS
jgi:dephospho-CoA kinase